MPQPQANNRRETVGQRRELELSGVQFRKVEDQERTYELSFSSEERVNRWWGTEILSHEPGAPQLNRLNDGGVLLYGHRTNIESVLGPVKKAWLDETTRKCRAIVSFDTDEDAERVFHKVESGTLRNVSCMYSLDAVEEVRAGATSANGRWAGPCEVVTKWTPYEVSIVAIPADSTVGVGRNEEALTPPGDGGDNIAGTREVNNMPPKVENAPGAEEQPVVQTERSAPPAAASAPPIPADDSRATEAAVAGETQRVLTITQTCRELGIEQDVIDGFIKDRRTVDQVNAEVLKIVAERNKPLAVVPRTEVVNEQSDKFRANAALAMMLRAGYTPEQLRMAGYDQPSDAATRERFQVAGELRHMSIRDLMEEDARLRGHTDASRWDVQRLMRDVFTPDSAFVSILDNTVNSSMLIGHTAAPVTFHMWTKPGSLPNLKSTNGFRISEAGSPQPLQQNGEYVWDEMTDEGIVRKLNTYAIGWGLTEDAIINDDLDVITQMPMAYATACRRQINHDVYAIYNLNPVIYDGVALFEANTHKNLAAQGAAPTVVTLSDGRKAMMSQKGLRNLQALNIQPKFLILGTDVEMVGLQLLASTADPAGLNSGVVIPSPIRTLVPICDGEITDANSWGLAADPNVCDTIGVDYLNGQESPKIEMRVGFRVLGIEWRLVHRWGVTVKDFRGLYQNPG